MFPRPLSRVFSVFYFLVTGLNEMQLSVIFAIAGAICVVLMINVAVLSRESRGEDLFDSETLRRVQTLLVDCQPSPQADDGRCDNASATVDLAVLCPPAKNASAEILAKAQAMMDLKQQDFQYLRVEFANAVKQMEEQKVGFQMALAELK
jgi:hypothetical protein